jgi:GTP-binding protein
MILINKWDLVEKETNTARDYEKEVKRRFAPFTDIPVLFISALDKQRIFKAIEIAMEVFENRTRHVPTSKLNDVMLDAIERNPPPSHRGRFVKIKYVSQLPVKYPAFAFFCNNPKHVKDSYRGYLENKLRENFNFTGVPVSVYFRKK